MPERLESIRQASLYRRLSVHVDDHDDAGRTLFTATKETADNDREPLGAVVGPVTRATGRTAITHAHETVDNDREAVISLLGGCLTSDGSGVNRRRNGPSQATAGLYQRLSVASPDPVDATRTVETKKQETVDRDSERLFAGIVAGRIAETRTRITNKREQVDADLAYSLLP